MKKQLFSIIAFTGIFLNTHAQKINMVKDINPSGDSYPVVLGAIDNKAIFVADDGTHGIEIWVSDGTATGTQMLKDILPGSGDAIDEVAGIKVNNKIYFGAQDATYGNELWVTDGTPAGTKIFKDINPGTGAGLNSDNFAYLNGNMFFTASNGTDGWELWMSDGTDVGTKMVKDINPGIGNSYPNELTTALGKVFFTANDGTHGTELWVTDGTAQGTTMVADLYTGQGNSSIRTLTEYNNKLYFSGGITGTSQMELHSTDGTIISLVKNINSSSSSNPSDLIVFNNKLFFGARESASGEELWVSDGTEMGTVLLKDLNPGTPSGDPYYIGELNGKLLFSAVDGTNSRKLWHTDGTANGTAVYADINPTAGDGVVLISSEDYYKKKIIKGNTFYNGVYYIAGDDGANGVELWRTNGTDTGTYMVDQVGATPDTTADSDLDIIFVDSNNVWLTMSNGTDGLELFLFKAPVPPPVISVNDVTADWKLSISPNPNNGGFSVELPNSNFRNGYLSVSDITGKIIYDQSIKARTPKLYIPLQGTPPGVYIVNAQLDGRTFSQKVTIQ